MPCTFLRKYTRRSLCALYLLEEVHLVEFVCLVLSRKSGENDCR